MIVMIQLNPDKSELWIKEVGSRVHRAIGLSELPSVIDTDDLRTVRMDHYIQRVIK
jgi:hypothetical protein